MNGIFAGIRAADPAPVKTVDQIKFLDWINGFIGTIQGWVVGIAVLVFLAGGITWLAGRATSPNTASTGSKMMIGSIIGMVLVIGGPFLIGVVRGIINGIFGTNI